jgi:hypothetical protein
MAEIKKGICDRVHFVLVQHIESQFCKVSDSKVLVYNLGELENSVLK